MTMTATDEAMHMLDKHQAETAAHALLAPAAAARAEARDKREARARLLAMRRGGAVFGVVGGVLGSVAGWLLYHRFTPAALLAGSCAGMLAAQWRSRRKR